MATDASKIPEWAYQILPQNNAVEEVRWWEAQNIPWQIVQELRRRSNTVNLGQNATNNVVTDFPKQHPLYRGPMTPWVRAFSNGTGRVANQTVPTSKYLTKNGQLPEYKGYLLQGGDGFGKAYGFTNKNGVLERDIAVIGYEADGKPHYIDPVFRSQFSYNVNTNCTNGLRFPQNAVVPSILPPPGIVSVNIKTNKEMMANATIQWKCYSLAQLEYMMPFWLTPKINVFLEFGWNLFDINSLLDLDSEQQCYLMTRSPQLALDRYYRSLGNYGLITGIINKYNFNTEDGFVYTCNTEIISRQAMYAGYRADNPTVTPITETVKGKGDPITVNTIEYSTLKDFFANYLQFAKEIIKSDGVDGNYINYILNHSDELAKKINDKKASNDKKAEAQGTVSNNLPKAVSKKGGNQNTNVFYNGQKENRMFMGRFQEVYGAAKLPTKETITSPPAPVASGFYNPTYTPPAPRTSTVDAIHYDSITVKGTNYKVISYADKDVDFDYNDAGNDEVWFQLDFVFDIINLFCAEQNSKNNYIDISDIVVSAHPNLLSCDKNVLIPNPRAPKVNVGRYGAKGYLEKAEANNDFTTQIYWETLNSTVAAGEAKEKVRNEELKKSPECIPSPITGVDPIWKAARRCRDAFRTAGAYRDNLDAIINWLYYHKATNPAQIVPAAFPFFGDVKIKQRVYQAGYYGYLKHIYISKSKLIEIGLDENLKTLEQIVNKILNIVNESVDNFWNLEVVNNPLGGLSIIDKNVALPKKTKIYSFNIGSTSSVIKKISFDVTLTNEQTNQVLYGSGQNAADKASEILNVANDATQSYGDRIAKITQIKTGLPAIVCADRFDRLELQKQCDQIAEQLNKNEKDNPFPPQQKTEAGAPHGPLVDQHLDIRRMQTQGKQDSEILMMRVRMLADGEDPYGPVEDVSSGAVISGLTYVADALGLLGPGEYTGVQKTTTAKFDWVSLNLPSTCKGKLREMLDDGDTYNNTAKYAGPSDNFTISLTFDGIMGFRMFQHFAIKNLPKPYVPGNVIFMINEVDHQLNAGKWETVVTAMLRCSPNQEFEFIDV